MFTFTPTDEDAVEITIRPDRVSDYAVPDAMFAKFTEVIADTIYNGVWAQALDNPSLEPPDRCLLKEADNPERRIAWRWFALHDAQVRCELTTPAFNSEFAQRIEVSEPLPEGIDAVGIAQDIFLPLARETRYDVSLYVKDQTAPMVVRICPAWRLDVVLGEARLDADGGDWHERKARLTLDVPDEMLEHPTRLWFILGLTEPGHVQVDQVTLWPADQISGFDPEVIERLRDYHVALLRFPGGNYVSGYHWKDDLVPLAQRRTRPNPAWPNCYDPGHVGTDEHLELCRLLGAEPMICVNAGDGSPEEAADWVEYCNGDADTEWGRRRAERGHPEPYNIRYWEIGNELWGWWQIGNCTPEEYPERYRAFHDAMKAVDPTIELIACSQKGDYRPGWHDALTSRCADIVDLFAVHLLFDPHPQAPPASSHLSHMGYSHFFEGLFRRMTAEAQAHGCDARVCVTELFEMGSGKLWQVHGDTMSEALFFAGTLNSAIRTEGAVEMITYSSLLNIGGGLRRKRSVVYPTPSYHARRRLTSLIDARPVAMSCRTPFAHVPEWRPEWMGPDPEPFPLVDAMAFRKGNALEVVVLNRDPARAFPAVLHGLGSLSGEAIEVFELVGATFMAGNDPLAPHRVAPTERTLVAPADGSPLRLTLPPASMTVLKSKL